MAKSILVWTPGSAQLLVSPFTPNNCNIHKIIRITNSESIIENIDKRDIDNIRRRAVNIEHIRRVLRWSPIYNLEKGLENTYDWLKKSI